MRRRGFTLLEVLIAVSIIAVIFSMIYTTYAWTIETKQYVEEGNDLYAMARLALDRMSREISMAYLRQSNDRDDVNYTLFVGEDLDSEGYPVDALHFTSVSHLRFGSNVRESDQNEISYYIVESSEGKVREFSNLDLETKSLIYREDPTIDSSPTADGTLYELATSVYGLNYRFYDSESEEWVDSWDSREVSSGQPGLPTAVEITLILAGTQGQELIFQTKVMVRQ